MCSHDAVDPCSNIFFTLAQHENGGFVRFARHIHGAANICLPEEGCELWQVTSFDGVMSRRMYINTRYAMYNVWKVVLV